MTKKPDITYKSDDNDEHCQPDPAPTVPSGRQLRYPTFLSLQFINYDKAKIN